jgi:hypothetical protein
MHCLYLTSMADVLAAGLLHRKKVPGRQTALDGVYKTGCIRVANRHESAVSKLGTRSAHCAPFAIRGRKPLCYEECFSCLLILLIGLDLGFGCAWLA